MLIFANAVKAQEYGSISRLLTVKDSVVPSSYIGVLLQASSFSKAKVTAGEGRYKLNTRTHSAFTAGLFYQRNLDSFWSMVYGLQVNLLSSTYYLHIPDRELPGFSSTSGAPQIEDKQVYYGISAPVLLQRNFAYKNSGHFTAQAGIKINYSGFSNDEETTVRLADTNLQFSSIFSANVQSNNAKKPWISFVGALGWSFILKNKGLLGIGAFIELSRTEFIQLDYQIMIPNQPVSTGRYAVSGTGVGMQLQYILPKKKRRQMSPTVHWVVTTFKLKVPNRSFWTEPFCLVDYVAGCTTGQRVFETPSH